MSQARGASWAWQIPMAQVIDVSVTEQQRYVHGDDDGVTFDW